MYQTYMHNAVGIGGGLKFEENGVTLRNLEQDDCCIHMEVGIQNEHRLPIRFKF